MTFKKFTIKVWAVGIAFIMYGSVFYLFILWKGYLATLVFGMCIVGIVTAIYTGIYLYEDLDCDFLFVKKRKTKPNGK